MGQFGFGQSVRRVEDDRLVIGDGQFTDDVSVDGQVYAAFARSPMAHAKILSVDTGDAKAAPGVIAVLTGADATAAGLGIVPCVAAVKNRDGSDMFNPPRPVLATERVRHVGDPIAVVIAESYSAAKDAAELIAADYEDLPAVVGTEEASKADSPVIWDAHGSNVVVDWAVGDEEATAAAFDKAAHVTELRLINNRIVVNALEPRAAVATYEPDTQDYTLYSCSQGVHMLATLISNFTLKIPTEKLRVVTGDVGGGFGMKSFTYPEYAAILWAAKETGRPVKWTSERAEAFLTDTHGRDHVTDCALAFDENNRILAVRTKIVANFGAYLSQYAPFIPTEASVGMQVGVYDIPTVFTGVKGVVTNTVPVDAYRGAGRPEATYVIERLIDKAARELGVGPDELRAKNYVTSAQMPYKAANGFVYDSGDFAKNMAECLEKSGWSTFEQRRAAKQSEGILLGRGLAYYVERAGGGFEMGRIVQRPDGSVAIAAGTQINGQGHETAYAQFVADRLGIEFDQITMEKGDTTILPKGGGTGGSRSLLMAATALDRAVASLIEKGKAIAATHFQTEADQIEFADGAFRVTGGNAYLSLAEAAGLAAEQDPEAEGLTADGTYESDAISFPNGCHICEIEIDEETGVTQVVSYDVVDDFGNVLNPLLVEGQVQGGVAQGLGQAMGELALFDEESGQLMTGSFMDYWMPRATDVPNIDFSYNEVPCATNPLGIKGCGEAGTVGAAPAIISAVLDALSPYGVEAIDMPITPLKVWTLLQRNKG